jgi:hypothetical protein
MKATIEVNVKKVHNRITNEMVDIDKLSDKKQIKKAIAKNLDIICKNLQDYFKKSKIDAEFKYKFDER